MKVLQLRRNRKGQATAEMAILGTVVMMLLAYLLQEGYLSNARQSLEMYTYREALRLSKQGVYNPTLEKTVPVGINLTVIRDVVLPSFFSGLGRRRLMASASVDVNPWIAYTPDVPQDLGSKQLFQIGERMIRNGVFIEVPPTKLRIVTEKNKDEDQKDQEQWVNSSIKDIAEVVNNFSRGTDYIYETNVQENPQAKTVAKILGASDFSVIGAMLESRDRVVKTYGVDDWTDSSDEDHILLRDDGQPAVYVLDKPDSIVLGLDEEIAKVKATTTEH